MYGCETMILMVIGQYFNRRELYDEESNVEQWKKELDMLIEGREWAYLRNEKHKALVTWAVNKKVKSKDFLKGLFILQRVKGPCKA